MCVLDFKGYSNNPWPVLHFQSIGQDQVFLLHLLIPNPSQATIEKAAPYLQRLTGY